jgi:hypothetical protein
MPASQSVATRRGGITCLQVVTNLGKLHDAMDEEDNPFMATIKREEGKGSIGSDSERSSIDPAKMSEDEEDDNDESLVDEVKDADTAKDTKHGYRLSLQQSIMFIFLKTGKNK